MVCPLLVLAAVVGEGVVEAACLLADVDGEGRRERYAPKLRLSVIGLDYKALVIYDKAGFQLIEPKFRTQEMDPCPQEKWKEIIEKVKSC